MSLNTKTGARTCLGALFLLALLSGCTLFDDPAEYMTTRAESPTDYIYHIGPGDNLSIFVWRNPDISTSVPVRPDGRISAPLVGELEASGKTTEELARDVEEVLAEFIRDPLVTVTVTGFQGEYSETIRVVGEAAKPAVIPYRKDMTVLDVMIAVGGLTEFADGNDASIVRIQEGEQLQKKVRLKDLIKEGDIAANVDMQPGDILIIPEAWF